MLFNIPISYEMLAVPRGKARARRFLVKEYVQIDVPIVDPEDAPIAVEWEGEVLPSIKHGGVPLSYYLPAWPEGGKMHTRLIGDDQYQIIIDGHGGKAGEPVRPERIAEVVSLWATPTPEGGNPTPITLHSEPGADNFERIAVSGREAAIAELRKNTEWLRLINGSLYSGTIEPRVIVVKCTFDPDGDGSDHPCMLAVVTTVAPETFAKSTEFRLGSWRQAVAKANKDNGDRPELDAAIRDLHARLRPKINRSILGEYAENSALYSAVYNSMHRFHEIIASERLKDLSRTGAILACQLLDAAEKMYEPGGIDAIETIGTAFIAYATTHGLDAERKASKVIGPTIRALSEREIDLIDVGLRAAPNLV
jgi:hypothetical protein